MEMLKPKDGVRLKVQYRPEEFTKVKGLPGDSFYIRYLWPEVLGTWDQGGAFSGGCFLGMSLCFLDPKLGPRALLLRPQITSSQ